MCWLMNSRKDENRPAYPIPGMVCITILYLIRSARSNQNLLPNSKHFQELCLAPTGCLTVSVPFETPSISGLG